jgi:hypothetical protein
MHFPEICETFALQNFEELTPQRTARKAYMGDRQPFTGHEPFVMFLGKKFLEGRMTFFQLIPERDFVQTSSVPVSMLLSRCSVYAS